MLFFIFCEKKKKSQLPSGRHFENVLKIDLIWRPLHNTWHAVWMCLFSFSLISRWNCLFLSFQFLFGSLGTHTKSTQVLLEYSASIRDLQAKSEKKNASHKSSTCHRGGSIQGLVLPFYYLTKLWNIKPPFFIPELLWWWPTRCLYIVMSQRRWLLNIIVSSWCPHLFIQSDRPIFKQRFAINLMVSYIMDESMRSQWLLTTKV